MFKPQRKPTSRANTRRMMYLVHTAHRGFNNGNLWDLQGYYYTLIQKSQEITEILVRAKGIEPSSKAWEAFVLPLYHARICVGILYYTKINVHKNL